MEPDNDWMNEPEHIVPNPKCVVTSLFADWFRRFRSSECFDVTCTLCEKMWHYPKGLHNLLLHDPNVNENS